VSLDEVLVDDEDEDDPSLDDDDEEKEPTAEVEAEEESAAAAAAAEEEEGSCSLRLRVDASTEERTPSTLAGYGSCKSVLKMFCLTSIAIKEVRSQSE